MPKARKQVRHLREISRAFHASNKKLSTQRIKKDADFLKAVWKIKITTQNRSILCRVIRRIISFHVFHRHGGNVQQDRETKLFHTWHDEKSWRRMGKQRAEWWAFYSNGGGKPDRIHLRTSRIKFVRNLFAALTHELTHRVILRINNSWDGWVEHLPSSWHGPLFREWEFKLQSFFKPLLKPYRFRFCSYH